MMWLLTTLAFAEANEAWVQGDHEAALAAWQERIDAGERSGDLHYNVGNAHYQLGDVPQAILSWRTAQLLSPRDGDIEANLEAARKRTEDRLEQPPPATPVLFWRTWLSAAEQGWAASALMLVFWACVALWRLGRRGFAAIPAAITGVLAGLLAASTIQTVGTYGDAGVVLAEAEVQSTASGGVVLFELHPGAEVLLGDTLGEQQLVELPDGRRGWMPAAALGVVDPRS